MEFNFDRSKSARQILISTLLSRRGQQRTQKTRQLKAFDVHSPKTISFFIHVNWIYVSHVAMQNANREASGLMRRDEKSPTGIHAPHTRSQCVSFLIWNCNPFQAFDGWAAFSWWVLLILCPQQIHDCDTCFQTVLFLYPFAMLFCSALPNTYTVTFDMRDYAASNANKWNKTKAKFFIRAYIKTKMLLTKFHWGF